MLVSTSCSRLVALPYVLAFTYHIILLFQGEAHGLVYGVLALVMLSSLLLVVYKYVSDSDPIRQVNGHQATVDRSFLGRMKMEDRQVGAPSSYNFLCCSSQSSSSGFNTVWVSDWYR